MNETEYGHLKRKIKLLINLDLDDYSASQMMRRLDGFILRSGAAGVVPYGILLENSPEECEKLRNFITINVSEFYRDMSHFEILKSVVLPELLVANHNLNIWSAGCSDGQEPYTVALLLTELAAHNRHRILATDIDKVSLKKAQAGGPYRPADLRNLPRLLTAKYFNREADGYRIIDSLRDKVEFREHNLMQDPFERCFDLILCRNVVIYFSDEAKQRLKLKFVDSLKEGGLLFIGATETILDAGEIGFQRLSPCFYRKTGGPRNHPTATSTEYSRR